MIGKPKVGSWFLWVDKGWHTMSIVAQATRITPKRVYYVTVGGHPRAYTRYKRLVELSAWTATEAEARDISAAIKSMDEARKDSARAAADWIIAELKEKGRSEELVDAAVATWQGKLDALQIELVDKLKLADPELLSRRLRRPTINVSGHGGW